MFRYRLLGGLLIGLAMGLATAGQHQIPIWENKAMYAVIIAYFAGYLARKYPTPIVPEAKSFRLIKSTEKW